MDYNETQFARMVREILTSRLQNELEELADNYGVSLERVENIAISLYVQDVSKEQWKSSRTKFMKIYEKEVLMLFENKVVDWDEMGFLLWLGAKFTVFEDNTLRKEDNSYCNQKDIVEQSGKSKATVSKLLKRLIEKKLIFEKKHDKYKNGKRYYISPYVLYRGQKIDSKLKKNLKELNDTFMDIWNGKCENNDDKIDIEINPDEFLTLLEEQIVTQCADDTYLNVT